MASSAFISKLFRQGVRNIGRPLANFALGNTWGSGTRPVRPRQRNLVGVFTGLGGVVYANNEQGIERRLQKRTPSSVMPESVNMLVENNISVPPAVLLESMAWDLLDQPEAQQQRMTLERWQERGHNVDPTTAADICRRFTSWFALHELQQIQDAHSNVTEALDEVLKETAVSLREVVSNGIKSITTHQQAGDLVRAANAAEKQIQVLDRIHDVLDDTRERLATAEKSVSERIRNYLAIAGGCALVFLGCCMIGTLPAGVDLSCCEMAIDCGFIALSASAFEFILSPAYDEYRSEVQKLRSERALCAMQCSRLQALLV